MRSHLASSILTQTVRASSVKLLSGQQLGFQGEKAEGGTCRFFFF